jgi:hypothetical protein
LPFSWDLGPSPSNCGTPTLKNNIVYCTSMAWLWWDFASSWDLWNWAMKHSVKWPLLIGIRCIKLKYQ